MHGHQQLSLFNAFHDERCFMPLHVYDADSGHCLLTVLRPGKTPDGTEVRAHIRRLVRRIRRKWPETAITIRGDSHYGRWEATEWCERNDVSYVFGLATNEALDRLVADRAEALGLRWEANSAETVRGFAETRYAAKSWSAHRRVVARTEVTYKGADTRYVVTNLDKSGRRWLYDDLYCARGQAGNLIERHKAQLASGRTSCRSPLANSQHRIDVAEMRLMLFTAAYWLMTRLAGAVPAAHKLAGCAFATLRARLLKVAVRVRETATRVRLAFAANCPDKALFRDLALRMIPRPG